MDSIEYRIRTLLIQFGITSRYKACPLLVEGVHILMTGECRGEESLYRILAARCGGDWMNVSRVMQRLVRIAWKNNPALWEEMMGKGPPSHRKSTKAMIYAMADWLQMHEAFPQTKERPLP